jgi:hypothetical protein
MSAALPAGGCVCQIKNKNVALCYLPGGQALFALLLLLLPALFEPPPITPPFFLLGPF